MCPAGVSMSGNCRQRYWRIVCINPDFRVYGTRVLDVMMVEDLDLSRRTSGGICSLYPSRRNFPVPLPQAGKFIMVSA